MTTWKPIERPAAPYYMPEGDIETFREMYEKDSWKDRITNARELLEEAYKEVKRTSKRAKEITLPDTFKEVLDQETGHKEGSKDKATFPQWLYFGVIGKANLIIHDTKTAEATLAYIDGEEITQEMNPPNVLGDVQYKIKGIEKACLPARVYVNTMNIDFFRKPEQLLLEWIEDSDTDKNKEAIEAFREEVTKHAFRQIVSEVAAETGDDEKQIADPAKRTPEQRARLIASMRKHIAAKQEAVWKSVLMQTYYYCRDVEKKTNLKPATIESVLHYAVAYYYTLHPEKDFTEEADPKEARDGAEAAEIYNKMLAFVEQRKRGESVLAAISKYIDADTKPEADKKEIKKRVVTTANTLEQYSSMLQETGTSDFLSTGNRQIKKDIQAGTATATKNNTLMTFTGDVELNPITRRVYTALLIQLTNQIPYKELDANKIEKARQVSFSVHDYMNWTGMKDKTAAYKHINNSIRTLLRTTKKFPVTIYEPNRKGKLVPHEKIRELNILEALDEDAKDGKAIKNGRVTIYFSFLMAQALSHSHIMKLPTALLSIDGKHHPHGFNLGYKLALNYSQEIRKKDGHPNIISVLSLLSFCPEIRSYEEVMEQYNGRVDEFIINPFTRDLDNLQEKGILAAWHYCESNGEQIPQEEINRFNYHSWIKWKVYYEMKDYPQPKEN